MKVTSAVKVVGAAVVGTALVGVTATVSFAATAKVAEEGARTIRVSVSTAGEQGNNWSEAGGVVSNGGRFVAFASKATNLVPGDTNGAADVFVRDTQANTTTQVSIGAGGAQPDGRSSSPSISADGRYVAFVSRATNLVPGDTNGYEDVFVRDLAEGTTTRVSVADDEAQAVYGGSDASISPDGRHVAFDSEASNLVAGDTNDEPDVFVRDLDAGKTTRVSVSSDGEQSRENYFCLCQPQLSNFGRHVIFVSRASTLVPGDTNESQDVFVHDMVAGTTSRVNVSTESAQADGGEDLYGSGFSPSITSDGRYAYFGSYASTLVPGDTNDDASLFRRDLVTNTTTLIKPLGVAGPDLGAVSANGRYICYNSYISGGSGTFVGSSFVRDLVTNVTTQVSVSSDGTPGNANSFEPSLSPDGRTAVFYSGASNLVEGDTNEVADIFLHKLGGVEPAGDIAGPAATFALNATELSAGQSVTLDQRKLTGGTGVERVVFWGDGSAPQTLAAGATTATHVYRTAGNYRVGMVLVDQAGNRTGAGVQGSSTVVVKP